MLTQVKEFRKEVREEFREVLAVMKFSFAKLDQRIGTLESEMLGMKKRLDQLEMQKGVTILTRFLTYESRKSQYI